MSCVTKSLIVGGLIDVGSAIVGVGVDVGDVDDADCRAVYSGSQALLRRRPSDDGALEPVGGTSALGAACSVAGQFPHRGGSAAAGWHVWARVELALAPRRLLFDAPWYVGTAIKLTRLFIHDRQIS